jgi:hypothetical protein
VLNDSLKKNSGFNSPKYTSAIKFFKYCLGKMRVLHSSIAGKLLSELHFICIDSTAKLYWGVVFKKVLYGISYAYLRNWWQRFYFIRLMFEKKRFFHYKGIVSRDDVFEGL